MLDGPCLIAVAEPLAVKQILTRRWECLPLPLEYHQFKPGTIMMFLYYVLVSLLSLLCITLLIEYLFFIKGRAMIESHRRQWVVCRNVISIDRLRAGDAKRIDACQTTLTEHVCLTGPWLVLPMIYLRFLRDEIEPITVHVLIQYLAIALLPLVD